MRKLFVAFFLSVVALTGRADNAMDTYVSQLMSRMTLEEKIGQLNLLPGGDIVTGKEFHVLKPDTMVSKGSLH